MAAPSHLASIGSLWPSYTWEHHCIDKLKSSSFNWTNGLVNKHGEPISTLNNNTWGIDIETCYKYCNNEAISYPLFNFQSFSSCLTNYFLPFLALTAQLPYETGNPWSNFMSFCLAVGSPALATYSLTITILNRSWVSKAFNRLRERASYRFIQKRYPDYEHTIRAARRLLLEGQQVPLRASQEKGWLSSLVVLPINWNWWSRLMTRLEDTRRGYTASLVAQMAFAIIAYIFTIISAFDKELGDPTTALQIASGSLWLWLIPVILGWIAVGTQSRPKTVEKALDDIANDNFAYRAVEPTAFTESNPTDRLAQKGLTVRTGLNPLPEIRHQTGPGGFDSSNIDRLTVRACLGFSVEGDERREGPIYNYARIFTWWQLATTMYTAFAETLDRIQNARRATDSPSADPTWDEDTAAGVNLRGNSHDISRYCALSIDNPVKAYPKFGETSSDLRIRGFVAFLAGTVVQFSTTGASVLIAYLTPTKGWGCRSGSYMLYGVFSYTIFVALLLSMLLSHAAMLRYQKMQAGTNQNPPDFRQTKRGFWHEFLCALAVILRLAAKSLAVINASWLIVSSLLEFTSGFDTCWCLGDHLGLGGKGWVVLFKNGADLAKSAHGAWYGGLGLTISVCSLCGAFFYVGCRDRN